MGALWGEEGEMWRGRDTYLEILNSEKQERGQEYSARI